MRSMCFVLPVSLFLVSSLSANCGSLQIGAQADKPILIASDDPGRDLTPDPHGGNPHDEQHDDKLPANSANDPAGQGTPANPTQKNDNP